VVFKRKRSFRVALVILSAVLGAIPLFAHAQGLSGKQADTTSGSISVPIPKSDPNAPQMNATQVRIALDILSSHAGNPVPAGTDPQSAQVTLRAEVLADPLAADMSSQQVNEIVSALSTYVAHRLPSAAGIPTSAAQTQAPSVAAPVAPSGNPCDGGAPCANNPTSVLPPYLVPFLLVILFCGLIALLYLLYRTRASDLQ
jgi:hypothetical protein